MSDDLSNLPAVQGAAPPPPAPSSGPPKSVFFSLAERYGVEPEILKRTLRATVFPPEGSNEEFVAFAMVAFEYRLNPLTKEIYAFPKRGGGIIPVVSIDGWVTLVNRSREFDGMEFEMHHDEQNKLVACTCRIYRKDRARPVVVTEYLAECKRPTDPWKMEHRMLRHKAMIQCARYAFGFSGIYDEDEAQRINEIEGQVVTRPQQSAPPPPPPPPPALQQQPAREQPAAPAPPPPPPPVEMVERRLDEIREALMGAESADEVDGLVEMYERDIAALPRKDREQVETWVEQTKARLSEEVT